jgi:hypothetical protein
MAETDKPRKSEDSIQKDPATQQVDHLEHENSTKTAALHGGLTDTELFTLRQRYPLLANASQEKLEELNKAVLRKLDWKFLPVITLMLLMK